MNKKRFYAAPTVEVLWLAAQASILAASDPLEGEIDDEASLIGFEDDW